MAVNYETSTKYTFLMYKVSDGYQKLADITGYGDIGGAPEMLDCTTCSDSGTRGILGLQQNDAIEYPMNYIHSVYAKIKALEGEVQDLAIWFGGTQGEDGTVTPTGSDGKYSFSGFVSVRIDGKNVNEVRTMTTTVAVNSAIIDETGAEG